MSVTIYALDFNNNTGLSRPVTHSSPRNSRRYPEPVRKKMTIGGSRLAQRRFDPIANNAPMVPGRIRNINAMLLAYPLGLANVPNERHRQKNYGDS